MLNNKFIKIIIAIVIIFVLIFIYLLTTRKDSTAGTEHTLTTESGGRLPLNTNNSGTTTSKVENGYYTDTSNLNSTDHDNNNQDDILKNKVEKTLFNWNITKDESTLREAVALSEDVDNEVVLEAWIPFMKTNSNELIKLINTSSDKQKTEATVQVIFQWYIELSGEYEKLSSGQKQQLTDQYNQLK